MVVLPASKIALSVARFCATAQPDPDLDEDPDSLLAQQQKHQAREGLQGWLLGSSALCRSPAAVATAAAAATVAPVLSEHRLPGPPTEEFHI